MHTMWICATHEDSDLLVQAVKKGGVGGTESARNGRKRIGRTDGNSLDLRST